jgi:transcriptional regulator with XRE-family HTH domain
MGAEATDALEPLGTKIRRQRRRLGLTLDELAGRANISKPYLSLIETGRVANPPSDEKLGRIEQTLGFPAGELLTQAHLQRTPGDVRALLARLLKQSNPPSEISLSEMLQAMREGQNQNDETRIPARLSSTLRLRPDGSSSQAGSMTE